MPVKDLSPKEYNEKYGDLYGVDVKTSGGTESYSTDEVRSWGFDKVTDLNNVPVYKKADGSYTDSAIEATSIDFDKDSGNITIRAPKTILENSDWIKDNFTNNDNFKYFAELYKQDPNGTTEISVTNADGSTTNKTIADLAGEYLNAFNEYVSGYKAIEQTRKELINATKNSGLYFSDSDVLAATHSMNRAGYGKSNTDVMYIPKSWDNFFDFSGVKSWNAENRTISAKDWYELYSLDGENVLHEDIINKILDQQAKDYRAYITGDYKDSTPEEAATEFAHIISAYSTIDNDNPNANFFTASRIFFESAGHTFSKGVSDLVATFSTGEAFILDSVAQTELTKIFVAAGAVADLFDGGWDSESYQKLNDIARAIRSDYADNSLLKQFTDSYEENLSAPVEGNIARLEKLASTGVAGAIVGNIAFEIVKQIVLTNAVGAAAEGVVSGAMTAGDFALFAKGVSQTAAYGDAVQIANTMTLLNNLSENAKVAKVAGKSANLLAQGLVDSITSDRETFQRALLGEASTGDVTASILKNVGYNAVGELSGLATSGGWKAFTEKTQIGAVTQATLRRGVNKVSYLKRQALDGLANLVKGTFERPTGGADWWQAAYKEGAEFSEQIATAAKGTESAAEAVEATDTAIIKRMEYENALDDVASGIRRTWLDVTSDPDLTAPISGYRNAALAVAKAEGGAGIEEGGLKLFSQESANYTVWKQRLSEYALKGEENLTSAELLSQKAFQKKVANFEASHSDDLVSALNNFIKSNQEYNAAFTRWELKNGLITEEQYQGWVSSGRYGENGDLFQHTARINDSGWKESSRALINDYASAGNYNAKLAVDDYSLKPGDVDANYLDPNLVNYARQVGDAKVIQGRNWGEAIMGDGRVYKEINLEGKPVVKNELKRLRNATKNVANDTIRNFSSNEDILKYDFAKPAGKFTGLESKTKKVQSTINKLLGLNKSGLNAAVNELSDVDIKVVASQFDLPEFTALRTNDELSELLKTLPDRTKNLLTAQLGENFGVRSYNAAIKNGIGVQMQRSLITGNNEIINSDFYKEIVTKMRRAALDAKTSITLDNAYKKYAELVSREELVSLGADDFTRVIASLSDDLVEDSVKALENNAFAKEMLDRFELVGVDRAAAKRYLVLSSYMDNLGKGSSEFNKMLDKNLSKISVSGNLSTAKKMSYAKSIKEALKENIRSEWSKSVQAVKAAGAGGELLDVEQIYNEVYEAMAGFIDNVVKQPTVIQVLDRSGNYHLYEVSPTQATLYKTRPNMYEYKVGAIAKLFNKTNRLMRIGTTGFSISSFVNQWMRDPMNAYVMGGMVRTVGQNQAELAEMFGEQIVQSMQDSMGKAGWRAFTESLGGEDVTKAAVRRSTTDVVNQIYEGVGGETAYYRQAAEGYRREMFGENPTGDMAAWSKAQKKAEDFLSKLEESKLNLGNQRELYLRKGTYTQAFRDAIDAGHTVKDAQTIAEFTMRQATTNFSRAFSWGNKIVNSVPYLGAAINGSASFWRLLEIDPVGVSGRFISGLVIPTMALVAQSLSNERDKEVYKNIPEYIKGDNLVFVVDGTAFKMPIPQELSAFLAPFRQLVEKSNGANNNSWLELIASDLLDISPIDLSGFIQLDEQTLASDESFWSTAVGSEAETLISQLSPVVVKSAYMLITGRDPYTGNQIDNDYKYFDDDGNLVTMDYTDNVVAEWFSGVLGKLGANVSPATASAILKNFFGNVGDDFAKALTSTFRGDVEGALSATVGNIAKPFTVYQYKDEADREWSDAVEVLEAKRNALLMANGDLNKISTKIQQLDPTSKNYQSELQNLRRQRNTIVQDYQYEVLNTVKNLEAKYGNSYDRKKFAATINLMVFDSSFTSGVSQAEIEANRDVYYNARNEALQTMADLGFNSPSDLSIFGYTTTTADGQVKFKSYQPTSIMNMGEALWGRGDVYQADITSILKSADITRSQMFGSDYNKAKAAGKSALKKYKSEWNSKVVNALYSYISDKGVDNIVGDHKTQELLDDYIFVDNPYKTKDYLKEIFK